MASDDTPILGGEPDENDKLFCEACDELKEKFGLEFMIVAASPKVEKDATDGKELIYISTGDNPLYLLQTSTRLVDFHIARELREYERSKLKALGVLGILEKIIAGKMGKPAN